MTSPVRTSICDLPLVSAAKLVRTREISPVELTQAVLTRVSELDERLNAFITLMSDSALAEAQAAEAEILNGAYRGPLHGIPVSVKDLFDTKGVRTTAGSRVLAANVPDQDATVVRRLRDAGAIVFGKANMLEFAYAAVHPDYGPTPNPWDLTRSTSGSSSGSAASVAAGMGFGSLGSDTGGSIRLPAAYCGIVGLKPTYGRVSRHGAIPVSWSCDHIGPITRTVADCAAMLAAIAGEDERDSTTGRVLVPAYIENLGDSLAGRRIGYDRSYLDEYVDPVVRQAVWTTIQLMKSNGAEIIELHLPPPSEAVPALLAIITAEATAYHLPWLRSQPGDYSSAVRERLELGAVTPAVSYIHAQRLRKRLTSEMLAEMDQVDVVAMPTAPTAATPLEDDLVTSEDADPALLAALINFTGPFDLTGFPAISIPCGFTDAELPIGLQLVGHPYREDALLSVAHQYESLTGWTRYLPTLLRETA